MLELFRLTTVGYWICAVLSFIALGIVFLRNDYPGNMLMLVLFILGWAICVAAIALCFNIETS